MWIYPHSNPKIVTKKEKSWCLRKPILNHFIGIVDASSNSRELGKTMVGKILIVDDVATNRIVQKVKLSAAFYQPILASDGTSCLAVARTELPDLILLEQNLPDMPSAEVLRRLAIDPVTRSIPVIVITALRDPKARLAALNAGAQEVLSKPVDDQVLLARMRSLIRARANLDPVPQSGAALHLAEPVTQFDYPGRVALVTSGDAAAENWRAALQPELAGPLIIYTSTQALAAAISDPNKAAMPDVFAIDTEIDDPEAGLRIMSELRSSNGARHSAICLIRHDDNPDKAAFAFDMGADDVFLAAMSSAEIAGRLQKLVARKRMADQRRASVEDRLREALIDPLTGLYNRRYALPQLAQIGERALADDTSFAAFVIDIDRFKAVNDRHGHAAGDAVLVHVAKRLSANLRVGDLLARIGGEEFLAVLPDISLHEARRIADRLCNVISQRKFQLPDGDSVCVTVSIGLAMSAATRSDQISGLIEDADHALLAAKNAGRNQVTMGRSAA